MRLAPVAGRLAFSAVLGVTGLAGVMAAPHAAVVAPPQDRGVVIFAASSMKTALDAASERMRRDTGITVRASYASSAVLARQIEDGAPADIFISADLDWMDYVDARGAIRRDTRRNLLGNALVLIAPAGNAATHARLTIAPGFALAAALGTGRLAIGEPTSVPAGKYAKAALTSLGVWDSVAAKLAPAENVRVALTLVSRGEAPLGVVYATDAKADPGVTAIGTFPASTHPPIVYPAALTRAANAAAAEALAYLASPEALRVFEQFGFTPPPR